jgi:hypothetical protein
VRLTVELLVFQLNWAYTLIILCCGPKCGSGSQSAISSCRPGNKTHIKACVHGFPVFVVYPSPSPICVLCKNPSFTENFLEEINDFFGLIKLIQFCQAEKSLSINKLHKTGK